MVRIIKADKELLVPNSAFKTIYKAAGWKLANDKKVSAEAQKVSAEPQIIEEEITPGELLEKPLEELTFKELEEVAEHLGVEVEGQKSAKKLREAIKEAQR